MEQERLIKYDIVVKYHNMDRNYPPKKRKVVIEGGWTDLAVAELNLDRIEKHYRWQIAWLRNDEKEMPKFMNEVDWKALDYFSDPERQLVLRSEENEPMIINASWMDFNMSLKSAEIIERKPELKKIEF